MIIRRLHIKNFGKFQNKRLEFSPGINIIYGENESGKSTLHTFIQGVFFGIRRMRGKASRNDTYSRYEPWENGAWYEGQIWFACGKKEFRLHRVFQKERQGVSLICETDGEQLSVKDGDLHVLLGNINETIYHNTVSIGQLKSQTEDGLLEELRNYVSNYQGTLDGELDLSQAFGSLKDRKKSLEQQKRAAEEERRKQLRDMELQMSYIRQELQDLRKKEEDPVLLQTDKRNEPKKIQRRMGWKRTGLFLILTIVFTILLFGKFIWMKWVGFGGWVCLLLFAFGAYLQEKKSAIRKQEENKQQEEKQNWIQEQLRQSIKEKQAQAENLQEEYEELLQMKTEGDVWREEIEAVVLAIHTIEELSRKMQNSVGGQLKERTSQILKELTGGKYTKVTFDADLVMGVDDGERYIPLEKLSKGTIEQIYFAFRMAMGEILCQEETLPVLLDDTFVMYDDVRTAAAIRWLNREKEQVLIFTCQKREQQILEKLGIRYRLIELG